MSERGGLHVMLDERLKCMKEKDLRDNSSTRVTATEGKLMMLSLIQGLHGKRGPLEMINARKMFIGGLNWETTDQSLKDYFSQFGEVQECTVMRDGATGRSRGFGFLTFKDARTVNIVMVKEHYLDGKIVRLSISPSSSLFRPRPSKNKGSHINRYAKIDPKRAIPRDEQERTSKIFVGGVSQDATEQDFKEYFMQYGRVVDATLMIDKDTGRPRGFGFVTFDNESAVDNCLQGDLMILGKPIEVKKAQPRGNMRDEDDGRDRRGGRRGGKDSDRFRDDRNNYDNSNNNNNTNSGGPNQSQMQNQQGAQFANGMTPQMMAQYWQRMQQFFAQQMAAVAAAQGGGMAGSMGMGAMNPAMMAQMKQMQMQQMQSMQQQQMGRQQRSQSPQTQSPGAQAMPGMQNMQGMNPAMLQQMQQLQQMQMQAQQAQGTTGFSGSMNATTPVPTGPSMGSGFGAGGGAGSGAGGGRRGTPGYNAQEQLMFEQQKYEQQQARRAAQEVQQMQYQNGPTSWEGMYDDVPQPSMGGAQGGMGRGQQGGFNRQMSLGSNGSGNKGPQQQARGSQGPPAPKEAPPANAPTGPKNAGVPGANYRGGGRGSHRGGFHPYARK
ncbi:hypothetical protein MMC13_006529 [Lambiella insularis]|nr:hypothetical protein [Lambiella insularis]